MTEYNAWDAILRLLKKLQYQPIGKKYDTGERQKICPICFSVEGEQHKNDCELGNAIKQINDLFYL